MAVGVIILGFMITILIAVLTAFGAVIKLAYDAAGNIVVTLHGDPDNGDKGFIQKSRERHEELEQKHEEVYEQLLIQGRLLSELTYAFADIAEELDTKDDVEVDVNLDRIRRLRERKDDHEYDFEEQQT